MDDDIHLANDQSLCDTALPMRWLAAGIPLTLLIDLAEPGHSREIAHHEATDDPPLIHLGNGPASRRSLV